jgi:hypothetical protein
MHYVSLSALGQVLLAAIIMLPIVLVVALSTPAWLITPFLSQPRRNSVAANLREIRRWHSEALDRLGRSWQYAAHDPRRD